MADLVEWHGLMTPHLSEQPFSAIEPEIANYCASEIASEVFEQAREKFVHEPTNVRNKPDAVLTTGTLEDVKATVIDAQTRYQASRRGRNGREWLGKVLARLQCYGNVMDTVAQSSPMYAGFAWGMMKFLFVAFINHDRSLLTLAQAISNIADELPRTNLAILLYPTDRMSRAISDLYAHILKFFMSALDWFETPRLRRVLQSVTRSVEIRYNDLLDNIRECSRTVDVLASWGSHAKLQAMRRQMRDLQKQSQDLERHNQDMMMVMMAIQSICSSAQVNTDQRLSDLQFSQVMTTLSNVQLEDPSDALQHCLFTRNNTSSACRSYESDQTSLHQELKDFPASNSSLVAIGRFFSSDADLHIFYANLIEALRRSKLAVIWALNTNELGYDLSIIDLLRYIIMQAYQLKSCPAESLMAQSCQRFQSAITEDDWLDLLGHALTSVPHDQIYLIIDLKIINSFSSPQPKEDFRWSTALADLLKKLSDRGVEKKIFIIVHTQFARDFYAAKSTLHDQPNIYVPRLWSPDFPFPLAFCGPEPGCKVSSARSTRQTVN